MKATLLMIAATFLTHHAFAAAAEVLPTHSQMGQYEINNLMQNYSNGKALTVGSIFINGGGVVRPMDSSYQVMSAKAITDDTLEIEIKEVGAGDATMKITVKSPSAIDSAKLYNNREIFIKDATSICKSINNSAAQCITVKSNGAPALYLGNGSF